jgi:hypothetical protein
MLCLVQSVTMLAIAMTSAECFYTESRSADCRYADRRYTTAERCYAECRYAECRVFIVLSKFSWALTASICMTE